MKAIKKRRILYLAGFIFSVFVIVSVFFDAAWVFRVFLVFNHRVIALDSNSDGKNDYFEFWEKGDLVLSEWDTNFDGKVDYRNNFEKKILVEVELDADFDGYFEYRERRRADGLFSVEIDEDKDGVFQEKTLLRNP